SKSADARAAPRRPSATRVATPVGCSRRSSRHGSAASLAGHGVLAWAAWFVFSALSAGGASIHNRRRRSLGPSRTPRMNRIDLLGRTAVVTGGARGIGYAIASRLIDSGATCSLWDLDAEGASAAAKTLSGTAHVQSV